MTGKESENKSVEEGVEVSGRKSSGVLNDGDIGGVYRGGIGGVGLK